MRTLRYFEGELWRHCPLGAPLPGGSPRWSVGKASLTQLSSRPAQAARAAASLAVFGSSLPGRHRHSLYQLNANQEALAGDGQDQAVPSVTVAAADGTQTHDGAGWPSASPR